MLLVQARVCIAVMKNYNDNHKLFLFNTAKWVPVGRTLHALVASLVMIPYLSLNDNKFNTVAVSKHRLICPHCV